ncbi:hypothetical protein B7P43_G00635 [Cryptotermes secundus]|uniref:G-protein coupled receptors family 2 profile 2 domain-containing protein n=1 Tax=Cryptotermes secundus TaxID=105785 RepID=A0A2J7QAP9_9NEOP|nr:hypothetical protein B7P43_G00635 [Cryptotermes secundus]
MKVTSYAELLLRRLWMKLYHKSIYSVILQYWMKACNLNFCEPTYSLQHWTSVAYNLSQKLKTWKEFRRILVRPVRMSSRTENTVTRIFRIKIFSDISAGEIETDHHHLNNLYSNLKIIASNRPDGLVEVLHVRSSKFCHKEETYGNRTLHWPVATIGQTVLPRELCVNLEGVPIWRQCTGDFVEGAFWSDENENNGTLYQCEVPSPRASFLHKLSLQVEQNQNAANALTQLQFALTSQDTKKFGSITHLTPAEIQYAANTLASLRHSILHDSDLPTIANITDAILKSSLNKTNNTIVENKMALVVTNASNIILDSIDHMLNKVELNYKETSLVVTPRFVTLLMDIETGSRANGGFQGLAARKPSKYSDKYFRKEDIITLSWNDSVETLLTLEVSAAVLLPPQLTQKLTEDICNNSHHKTCNGSKKHRLVINLFWDDGLFVANSARSGMPLHVLSVTLDGEKHPDLNPPLILLFDSTQSSVSHNRECVFWDFKANAGLGNWSNTGCTPTLRLGDYHTIKTDICICTHLTHFGQLISPTLEQEIDVALDMITIVGCSFSLLGLFGIALTATVFPDWRHGASKKIQLHLSSSLATLMLVFLLKAFLFTSSDEPKLCLVLGVALHFSLIATFCWMLVAAWFQYLRLTKPLASLCRAPHILLKAAVFAWGFPFIPCGTLLIVSPDSYNSSQCYPTGMAHYFSVIAPISIIISINITMFVLIICSIYKLHNFGEHADNGLKYTNSHQLNQHIACRRLSTLIFLFFLLGLSWIFGIWKLSYLFCCTATLQGFAFFVFFVVLEKNTRAKWSYLFTRKKPETIYPFSNRNSSGSVVRRSCDYQRTSRNTISTLSSLS